MAVYIDGKALAAKEKERLMEEAKKLPRKPGLAVILVGDDPASRVYVNNKEKDCAQCGFLSREYLLPEQTREEALLELIAELNQCGEIDGILVQLPLPRQISEQRVIEAIAQDKDVDAFHPANVGRMMTGDPYFLPCTPAGIMEMFRAYGISVAGKRCVVVGRSNIVGKPMAQLLIQNDGTVTTCHTKTKNLSEITRQADILVSAAGQRNLITGDMVKEGVVVIDVAMNRNEEGKFCGDVNFAEVSAKASYITPVPGGVGPMTRVILLRNILTAAQRHQAK
ncbi:bifunctional methylenetetrahydrofolate dehydrogenase/methenyltetrahydrofolate cyclohydrolase FolD [Oscillibacter hominis]|uniref:Bifunctional protein FolD n=1 Tax=Oscillibacter hominis TaxID=2763056 RepID=A0A7G9B149_9FIRM|nr:bifunctional methylenetetrahydrofolate dehydrogenase/methenyltetrahydrofolate cyclohydrolase FolD [Oscillibacter hominis]QNL43280.1 bifunctional methylenetetrahydrofolate dehydrogenase/methenyltetrahydrofolate cyclohydrolase FolD [Oscillibacter hominis]